MPGSLVLSLSTLYGFLLVLARVGGALVFLPLPGVKDGPQPARVVLALSLTFALYPAWPVAAAAESGIGRVAGFILSEAAFGITAGLAVAFLAEAFLLAAQVTSMQGGFTYASTVDPTTQADANVLIVFSQLIAGLLFFACGLDRQILKIFARSLETCPPGSFRLSPSLAEAVLHFAGELFSVGLRLALPVMALLVLVDISLALLGRLNAQLQLLSMVLPAKLTVSLFLLAWMSAVYPRVYLTYAGRMWTLLQGVLTGPHG
jgi:flagellar biosynthetic protein FliR